MDQLGIAIAGALAVFLSQDPQESRRRWACIFGMLGEPFWFYAAWDKEQWGIFILAILYTVGWALGIWNNWFRMDWEKPL